MTEQEAAIQMAEMCGYELKKFNEIYFGCPDNWVIEEDWEPQENIAQMMEVVGKLDHVMIEKWVNVRIVDYY